MKTRVILATLLVVLLALPLAVSAQEPEVEVEAFHEAVNNGEAAAAAEKLSEEVVATVPVAMSESGGAEGEDPAAEQQAVGKAEVEAWIEGLTAVNANVTLGACAVEGQTATCEAGFTSDALMAKGVDMIEGELMVVLNAEGLIESYSFVASAESVAAMQAATGTAATPETIAVTGGASLPPNALVTLVGGLMVAGALGMQALKRRGR